MGDPGPRAGEETPRVGERQGWRPLGWAELKDIVRDGSEAALARLGRAPDVQARYVEHLGWVHATYDSVESFILEAKLGFAAASKPGGKLSVAMGEGLGEKTATVLNDFGYWFTAPEIKHYLHWSTTELGAAAVEAAAREVAAGKEYLVFVNPAALKSVRGVWHAHVLVKEAAS